MPRWPSANRASTALIMQAMMPLRAVAPGPLPVALLADDEEQADAAVAIGQQGFHRLDHAGDDALGVAGAEPPDELAVLPRGEKRRHGIDVCRERDHQRIAPLGKDIAAPRFH